MSLPPISEASWGTALYAEAQLRTMATDPAHWVKGPSLRVKLAELLRAIAGRLSRG